LSALHPSAREERSLLRDVARAYTRAIGSYEQHQARGNSDLADAAFTKMQEIEQAISIRELNSSWRD
jgi:hypothetical protein